MTITLLTGNHFKIETAQLALKPFNIKVEGYKTELSEIQDNSVIEIAKDTAIKEAQRLNKPVVREDHGFAIEALKGFPGPYMSFVERTLSAKQVLNLMKNETNRSATFDLGLTYVDPIKKTTMEVFTQVECKILKEIKLDNNLSKDKSYDPGWSSIIAFKDENRSWAQFPYQERMKKFTKNFTWLGKHLRSNKK